MMIDFENDNPYAPPVSSGEQVYEGNINSSALQYLSSAGKWALFYAIMTALLILVSFFGIEGVADIFGILINIVIYGMLAFFAWKYAQNAKLIQTNPNTEQLAQCTSPLNTILIINGVLFILALVLAALGLLLLLIAAVAG
ncbi:MAG: hypothetical protein IJ187_02925 [Neisseriaceae bacterium]|nr:hypothetical protein [Neisseriaceae bacterium]MBQ9258792.1 hypothetical protein [Neisseriaceae bacterium]